MDTLYYQDGKSKGHTSILGAEGVRSMNRLAAWYELTIFVTVPGEQRGAGKAGWWNKAPRSQHIPSSFARAILLTTDAALLVVAGVIGFTTPVRLFTATLYTQ